MARSILLFLTLLFLAVQSPRMLAHGSVTADDDLCIIQIGFYRAHFSIFQPDASGQEEFCEDVPRTGESIFVMEYLHAELGSIPIDFRIIRDVTGLGRFANVEDLEAIEDIEAATVFYRPPSREPGVYTVLHDFDAAGDYLGIVKVEHPQTGEVYSAVFPFKVGFTGWGLLPLFAVLALLVQLGYWYATGGFARWRDRKREKEAVMPEVPGKFKALKTLAVMPLLVLLLGADDPDKEVWATDNGAFRVTYSSELTPVPINQIHAWTLHVETAEGEAVENAELEISGGMPAHDHGLPTSPGISEYLGDGNYRVQGLRFHMMGAWEIYLSITAGDVTDTVVIPLEI